VEQLWVFLAIAEIAGVFVGFGALISVSQQDTIHWVERGLVRGCVTAGLLAMAGAMLPVGVAFYGVEGHTLWLSCAVLFLALDYVILVVMNRTPDNREYLSAARRLRPGLWRVFWLMEVGVQLPLALIVFGVLAAFDAALYVTAVLFALAQAGYILGMLVYVQRGSLPSRAGGA
jgi:hypothetical protein